MPDLPAWLPTLLTAVAAVLCLVQAGIFSGLNLALLGVSRLRLEVEAKGGNPHAVTVLALRRDANHLLASILWGNVAVNVGFTLLTDSLLTGFLAFLLSTLGITLFGEILPQAWFSRNAIAIGARLAPMVRVWQVLLWPLARPTGWVLDRIVGTEGIAWFRERDVQTLLELQMAEGTEMSRMEALGAMNLLELDDVPVSGLGQTLDPTSVLPLPRHGRHPVFPPFDLDLDDPFVLQVAASGRHWIVLTDVETDEPMLVLDGDSFLRELVTADAPFDPLAHCHRPVIVRDPDEPLGQVIRHLEVEADHPDDDVIEQDLILYWGEEDGSRRVVTGSDLLGWILKGIVGRKTRSRGDQGERSPRYPR